MLPIILLGSGNSGSGAIKDYLIGRGDIFDPLYGQEFRLIQEKDGLSCLHKSLTSEFHPDKAMYAILQFKELANRLGQTSKKFSFPPKLGYGFSKRIPGYNSSINNFIEKITACTFEVVPLRDLLNYSTLDWLKQTVGSLPRSKRSPLKKPIPVLNKNFEQHALELINDLFYSCNKSRFKGKVALIFDQAGSFWSPISSTQYFGEERKVIVVKRDPRDIFAQNKRMYGGNVIGFTRYYNSIMAHISQLEWNNKNVLIVDFESFVLNHEKERNLLCQFLDITSSTNSTYNPIESEKNIGLYKKFLSEETSKIIEKNCLISVNELDVIYR